MEAGTTEEGVAPLELQGSRMPKRGVVVGLFLKGNLFMWMRASGPHWLCK